MSFASRTALGYRFGVFEVDIAARKLRKQGHRIKLQEKPFQTLVLLLEHSGELVTRENLRDRLWPADTFVQFDDNLNTAVKRVREALGDSAETPRYVETVPRRGYRFLPPVETMMATDHLPEAAVATVAVARPGRLRTAFTVSGLLAAAALLIGVGRMLPTASWGAGHPAAEPSAGRIMLAVLPFRNLTGDSSQEYISDGMTEELIAHLGRLNPASLRVIARSSVMRYKSVPVDVEKVGQDLGVAYVLEGSLRRSGEHVGVTAQLVHTNDRTHLWAETYERRATDLLTIQRDVARGIAEALAIRFLPEQESSLARASTTNTAAYDAWLNGLYQWNRGTNEGFRAAATSFERATALDPGFALAHDSVARAYLSLVDYRFMAAAEGYSKARQETEIALRLDEGIPQSHELSAEILDKTHPHAVEADQAYRKAIALNPSDAYAQRTYAMYLLGRQHNQEAVERIQEAVRLDPLSPGTRSYAAYVYYRTKDPARSQEQVNRALAVDAGFPFACYVQGHLDSDAGRLDAAIAAFQKAVVASGRTPKYLYSLAETYIKAGKKEQAAHLLAELRAQSEKGFVPAEFLRNLEAELMPGRRSTD